MSAGKFDSFLKFDRYTEKLNQGYYKQSGTVLRRSDSLKEGSSVLLFLRDLGPRWVSAPQSSGKSRFGGGTEPLVWGVFDLYQNPSRLYLQGALIKEDFLMLRKDSGKLLAATRLYKNVQKALITACPNNAALNILWNAMLLLSLNCSPDAVEFRFYWRLLNSAGLSPSLYACTVCGGLVRGACVFADDGISCPSCGKGDFVTTEELSYLRRAAMLKRTDFIAWQEKCDDFKNLRYYANKLLTFF